MREPKRSPLSWTCSMTRRYRPISTSNPARCNSSTTAPSATAAPPLRTTPSPSGAATSSASGCATRAGAPIRDSYARTDCRRGDPMSTTHPANIDISAALAEAQEQYSARNPRSLAQYEEACAALPGGNTRSAIYVEPFPLTMARGEGAHLWDVDGHEYVDFLSEFTAGIYGHSNPVIRAAVEEALATGINLGAQNAAETQFAEAVRARFPSIELVRFTNSGTEANLMALAGCRAITGRDTVMVFDGAYHGGVFYFRGPPSPVNAPFRFVVAPYNDVEEA